MREINLNGVWNLHTERFGDIEAAVPGCLHTDLLRAGKIKNPLIIDYADDCRELEHERCAYEKCFVFEKDSEKFERIFLEFSALDVYCDVYLNGEKLGFCDNMFVPHRFDVTETVKHGETKIEVRFYPPADYVKDRPARNGVFTTERLYTRRIQCTYFWDWVDRFVTMGICGDVTLLMSAQTEIDSVFADTLDADPRCAQIDLSVDFACVGERTYLAAEIKGPQGGTVYSHRQLVVESNEYQTIDIENPQLWFPNGYGSQPLYTAILTVESESGEELSRREVKFGIRKVKAVQLSDGEGGEYYEKCKKLQQSEHLRGNDNNDVFRGFTVVVNGVPIMCKGADWVPCEPFVSEESDGKITKILSLSRDAGMNIVRVWGGGVFEKEHFYSECDRLGLMVCQDFLMACGDYPQFDDDFCDNLRCEAEYITKKLRNHASFIMWIGDNENAADCDDDVPMYPGRRAVRDVILPVVRRNDPGRIFIASSPYGGKPYMGATSGTTHNTSYLKHTFDSIMYTDLRHPKAALEEYICRFSTEEPTVGAPQKSSVLKFMTVEEFRDDSERMWRFHTKNNTSCFTEYEIYDSMRTAAKKLYGDFADADDKLLKMQYLQYRWVSETMELHRRNKGFSSGVSYWMLNDCWPAFGWALIDYYAVPKAGWYGFKHSAAGVKASFDADGNVFVCNDTLRAISGSLTLYRVSDGGCDVVIRSNFNQAADKSSLVLSNGDISGATENCIYICDMVTAEGSDRAVWYPDRLTDTEVKSGNVEVVSESESSVTLRAHGYVQAVMLDGDGCVFDDNCFTMLDGEERMVGFTGGRGGITVGII